MLVKELREENKLLEENIELRRKIAELEAKLELLEKGIMFLAERLDMTDAEVGFTANNEYLLKQILQK